MSLVQRKQGFHRPDCDFAGIDTSLEGPDAADARHPFGDAARVRLSRAAALKTPCGMPVHGRNANRSYRALQVLPRRRQQRNQHRRQQDEKQPDQRLFPRKGIRSADAGHSFWMASRLISPPWRSVLEATMGSPGCNFRWNFQLGRKLRRLAGVLSGPRSWHHAVIAPWDLPPDGSIIQ